MDAKFNIQKNKKKDFFEVNSSKDILIILFAGGGILAALTFAPAILAAAIPVVAIQNKYKKKERMKKYNSFYYLKKNGYIAVESKKGNMMIRLTGKGKKKAKKLSITQRFKKPKQLRKWDKNWWVVVFDIESRQRIKRDALRNLIKKIGLYQLQKSVWVYPYDCSKEIKLLKDFFSLNDDQVRVIVSSSIGDDRKLRKIFKL